VRLETHGPDLSYKIPASLLKESVNACRIVRIIYLNTGLSLR